MTTQLQYPRINGLDFDWSCVEAKLAGQIWYCKSVKFARKRNRTMVRVNHPDPISKTRGENEYSGSIEMLLPEANAFQRALIGQANANGLNGGYGEVPFQVLVQFTQLGLDTVTVTMNACTMDSFDMSPGQGTEPLFVSIDLAPLKILINGQDDLATPLQAPPGGVAAPMLAAAGFGASASAGFGF